MNANRYEMHVTVQSVNGGFNGEYRMTFETSEAGIEAAYRHAKPEQGEARFVELIDLDTNGRFQFKTIDGSSYSIVEVGHFGEWVTIGQEVDYHTGKTEYSVEKIGSMWTVTGWVDCEIISQVSYSTRSKADSYAQTMAETSRIELIDWTEDGQAELIELVNQVRFCLWASELTGQVETIGYSARLSCGSIDQNKTTELIENLNANGLHVVLDGSYLLIQAM